MAKLSQVLGAILSDITKAQAISDAYTRDLKPSYKEDPSLKLLSVPRPEINNVTIDLKFAILNDGTGEAIENQVIIYQDVNYGGVSQGLGVGVYDIADLEIGDDQLSSLKVPKGLRVTLYEHGGASGRSKSFTEDTPWVGDDFDDTTSFIKVERNSMADFESLEIEVITDNLVTLPEAAISSLEIKLVITSV